MHDVAVVFVTATGKSLPGPVASIDVGQVPAPATAPAAGDGRQRHRTRSGLARLRVTTS